MTWTTFLYSQDLSNRKTTHHAINRQARFCTLRI